MSETIKRINASALDLVIKRVEIDSRIRLLQQAVRGLRYLEAREASDTRYVQSVDSGPTQGQLVRRYPRRRCGAGATTILARACRIALMEAESAVPLEEVHARIVRRGSFSFSGSESPTKLILCTLNAMTARGELRRLRNGEVVLWRRIVTG